MKFFKKTSLGRNALGQTSIELALFALVVIAILGSSGNLFYQIFRIPVQSAADKVIAGPSEGEPTPAGTGDDGGDDDSGILPSLCGAPPLPPCP